MRDLLFNLVVLVFVFLNAGCSTAARQPAIHDFGLTGSVSTHEGNPVAIVRDAASPHGTVTVAAPSWLWDNRIRYRLLHREPTQVRFYGLDTWIAPPPELVEQMLESKLKALNYSLNIQLLEFEQQFDASDKARVVLRFSVDAFSGDKKQKIGTQEFHLERATITPDAAGAVRGFTDIVHQAAGRIQDWLVGLSGR